MHNKLTDELAVCGMNAALAVGEHHPQSINRLFLREDRLKSFTGICKQLAERKRPYKICEDEELERICKSVHHQGVVVMIAEPEVEPLTREDLDLWAGERKTGVVLHSVGNDHNLGAIARAAVFFDAGFLVLNENDSEARLTTSAYRVAEGALEHLTVRKITNTASFLKDASKQLLTVGTDTRARMRISDLKGIVKDEKAKKGGRPGIAKGNGLGIVKGNGLGIAKGNGLGIAKGNGLGIAKGNSLGIAKGNSLGIAKGNGLGIALVLGNEETGLPQNVKDQCSCLLRVPGTGSIDSLNVSQVAALFLHAIFEL